MLTTAFLGAAAVALGTGAGFDDAKLNEITGDTTAMVQSAQHRADATEQGFRAERTMSSSVSQAPDAWVLPIHGYRLSSGFGMRWGRLHAGLDLAIQEGTPYTAVHAGTVVLARWNGGYGYCIIIDHGNGLQTLYGHSSRLLVQEGQKVGAGDIIGLIGNTGHSFGAHLHIEIHVNGKPLDPKPWFRERGVDFMLESESVYEGDVGGD